MPDTHVPLDENLYYYQSKSEPYTQQDVDNMIEEALVHLKHTICAEIEEKKVYAKDSHPRLTSKDILIYNQGLDDALSVKSLKESE